MRREHTCCVVLSLSEPAVSPTLTTLPGRRWQDHQGFQSAFHTPFNSESAGPSVRVSGHGGKTQVTSGSDFG